MEIVLVLVWWTALTGLGALGLPIAAWLCDPLPGRGSGFAVPAALTVVTLVAFWVGHVAFGRVALVAGLGVLALASWAALRAGVDVDRRATAEAFAVFTLAFVAFTALRATNPEIAPAGSEDFLDFGLLKSLSRSSTLPPEQMWFAGEQVHYYYGGPLLGALLSVLTGTAPRYAYALTVAVIAATLTTAAYELAGAIGVDRGVKRWHGGVAGVFFVALAANIREGTMAAIWVGLSVLPDPLQSAAAGRLAGLLGTEPSALLESPARDFSYWSSTRVIDGAWTEFPLFTFLRGDLHAYVVSAPFLMFGAALTYSYYRTREERVWRRRAVAFGAVPAVGGLVGVTNTWDLPTVIGLTALTLVFAPASPTTLFPAPIRDRLGASPRPVVAEIRRMGGALVAVSVTALVAVAVAVPFFLGPTQSRPIAVVPASARSGFFGLVLVHGAFLAVLYADFVDRAPLGPRTVVAGAVAVLALAVAPPSFPALALFAPLLVGMWVVLRTRPEADFGYEWVLAVAGLGLLVLVEVFYVVGSIESLRINTVFKFSFQVWLLWGVACGAIFPSIVRSGRLETIRLSTWRTQGETAILRLDRLVTTLTARGPWVRLFRLSLAVGVVLLTSTYGGLALADRAAETDELTLDGLGYAERQHPAEMAAIEWLDDRPNQPTVVSAPTLVAPVPDTDRPGSIDTESRLRAKERLYEWRANPVASLTGLPTVAGWELVAAYSDERPYYARVSDVRTIYTGPPPERARLLERYDVRYVYVGPSERVAYDVRPFGRLSGVSVAFTNEKVTIYRVERSRLGQ